MKKILFSFLITLGSVLSVQAQTKTITGTITDANQQPVPNTAVFFYGSYWHYGGTQNLSTIQNSKDIGLRLTYTDANGNYFLSNGTAPSFDTLLIGVFDCQQDLHLAYATYTPNNTVGTANIQLPCLPDSCDVIIKESQITSGEWVFSAVPLVKALGTADFLWSYDNISRQSGSAGWALSQGYPDTLHITSTARPQNVCFTHLIGCGSSCLDTASGCSANYFVDTVNSLNFQGQIVLWENSTLPSGATTTYVWDFGDGHITSGQYPSHTYLDTGVYQICLTIQSVVGNDTCIDTFCDSIGFDANGNLVYKTGQQGFTVNVMDPSQVSQEEFDLQDKFSLYPNPSQGVFHLNWEEGIEVSAVEILSINGQLMRSIPTEQQHALDVEGLQSGVYVLRAISDKGVNTMRLLVE
jgi:hypothetical protein